MLSPNRLVDYALDLKVILNKNFKVRSNEKSISFLRTVSINGENFTFAVAYDVESKHDFNVACRFIKDLIEHSLFQFDDQFYIDRSNGVPLISDSIVDRFNPETGEEETVRLDSINDWFIPVRFKNKSGAGGGLKLSEQDENGNYKIL